MKPDRDPSYTALLGVKAQQVGAMPSNAAPPMRPRGKRRGKVTCPECGHSFPMPTSPEPDPAMAPPGGPLPFGQTNKGGGSPFVGGGGGYK